MEEEEEEEEEGEEDGSELVLKPHKEGTWNPVDSCVNVFSYYTVVCRRRGEVHRTVLETLLIAVCACACVCVLLLECVL